MGSKQRDPNQHRPLRTNNRVYESVARVRIDDTTVDNETVRITVEHAEHSWGVVTWLVYEKSNIEHRLKSHLAESIEAELIDVEIVDTVGTGLSAEDLIDIPATAVDEGQQAVESNESRR